MVRQIIVMMTLEIGKIIQMPLTPKPSKREKIMASGSCRAHWEIRVIARAVSGLPDACIVPEKAIWTPIKPKLRATVLIKAVLSDITPGSLMNRLLS